ncbi:hypothetical protein ACFODL_05030 [Phenylobacterium terrae]|uniref:Uncharacterized protein n=1 Tax=Phenylobacterium terrae TaxID=2665495 RepID=A0ABW4MXE5_9CAUL
MSKPVATAADVKAVPSTSKTDVAGNTGAVTAGPAPLAVVTDPRLKIGGQPVATRASQIFTFSGQNASSAPVTYPSAVTLAAGPTKLRVGGKFVLVDGDVADDAAAALIIPANRIEVSSARKLKTS